MNLAHPTPIAQARVRYSARPGKPAGLGCAFPVFARRIEMGFRPWPARNTVWDGEHPRRLAALRSAIAGRLAFTLPAPERVGQKHRCQARRSYSDAGKTSRRESHRESHSHNVRGEVEKWGQTNSPCVRQRTAMAWLPENIITRRLVALARRCHGPAAVATCDRGAFFTHNQEVSHAPAARLRRRQSRLNQPTPTHPGARVVSMR